jgi:hypothetical protein
VQSAEEAPGGADGLAELDKRRQRRRPLAPRNPRLAPSPAPSSEPLVDLTETSNSEAGERTEPDPEVSPETTRPPAPAVKAAGRRPRSGDQTKAPEQDEAGPEPLRLAQFYVTPAIDKYLRAVRAEALTQDLDVTASAVARMALQRLADETTPEELVRQLGEPKKGRGRGRPRR